jgi:3',5'-cyclic AMP phosphodiesterase CpdA
MKDFAVITRRNFIYSLLGFSTSWILPKASAYNKSFKPFSFAYITDCYLANGVADSFKQTQESQLFLQDAIRQINSQGVDFVIFGGDQVDLLGQDEVNWQLFIDVVQMLNCPWYFVLGDRDVQGLSPSNKLGPFGRDFKGKGLAGETPYWSLDVVSNVHLIGLDTSRVDSPSAEISEPQLSWLQEDLSKNQGLLTIVVSHHPLLLPAPYNAVNLASKNGIPQSDLCRRILANSKDVRLALSGHLYVSKVLKEGDIWYVCSPGLTVYPCSYRIFHVQPENISMQTYQVNFPALIKKARANLLNSSINWHYNAKKSDSFVSAAQGEHKDQNAYLPIGLEHSLLK